MTTATSGRAVPAVVRSAARARAPAPSRETDRRADLPATRPESAPARKGETAPARRASVPARRGNGAATANRRTCPRSASKHDKPMPLRPNKIKFSDRDPSIELEINEIAGHLTFTPSTVTAWYSLPEVRWAFRPDAEREALLSAISEQYAGPGRVPAAPAPHQPAVPGRRVGPHGRLAHPAAAARRRRQHRPGRTTWSPPSGTCCRSTTPRARRTSGVTFARRSLGDTLVRAGHAAVRQGRLRRRAPQARPHRRAVRRGARTRSACAAGGSPRRSWNGCCSARSRSAWPRPGRCPRSPTASGNAVTCSPSPSRSSATAPRTARRSSWSTG